MEQKIFDFYNRIINSKVYVIATAVLFPFALIVMGFVNVNKGVDLSDSTYSISNAYYLDTLDSSWFFPVFYSNLTMKLIMLLPGGTTYLGINIYSSLIKILIALGTFYFFTELFSFDRLLVFASEITCLGLCWCPVSIMYNYLTYFLLFGATALVFAGLIKNNDRYLMIAGFFLGTNFFVRFPNIVETSLILLVWYEAFLSKRKFSEWGKRTLVCIGGFFAAFIPAGILIAVTRGFGEYFSGIRDLFAMTGTNSEYSGYGMIIKIIQSYRHAWTWLEFVILFELLVLLASLIFPQKLKALRYVFSSLITVGMVILLYRKGFFSFDYTGFGSVYHIGKIVICLAIILFVTVIFAKNETYENKLLAFSGLLITGLSPLGTNNEIYANLNNMFWVLPVFLYLLCRFISTNEYLRAVRFSVLLIAFVFVVQSFLFGITYKFRDGINAPMDTRVNGIECLYGMNTTADNAHMLEEVAAIWEQNNFSESTVLLYGNVCGFGYVFDTRPAISSVWPSLDSYLENTFRSEMGELEYGIDNFLEQAPVVVISGEERDGILSGNNAKQEILKDFLEKYDYNEIYNNSRLSVYSIK